MDLLRILLVDDHLLFRKGLARLLDAQPDFEVIGEAADGLEALRQVEVLHPDVVLMDIRMPRCDGLEATRRIKHQMPNVKVVMLTVSDGADDLATAIRYGADGYLIKDLLPDALFQHLRGLVEGKTPISQAMTGKLFDQVAQQSWSVIRPQAWGVLTRRECQVLALVVDGYSNREIAQELGIAHNTVKNHLRSILTKLGAKNRAQASAYAIARGFVCLPTSDNSDVGEKGRNN